MDGEGGSEMVVSTVTSWIDSSADTYGDPGRGGFDTVGTGGFGTVRDDGDFYGANPEHGATSDGGSGGIFDVVRDSILATTGTLPPDLVEVAEWLGGGGTLHDGGEAHGGGDFLDELPPILGGDGGGRGSALGEAGPDEAPSSSSGGLEDVFDAPMSDAMPGGGDGLPGDAAPAEDDLGLDLGPLDDGTVATWGNDEVAVDEVAVVSADDFDTDVVDYSADELVDSIELPEIEVPDFDAPSDFEQRIESLDDMDTSVDDLFDDLG